MEAMQLLWSIFFAGVYSSFLCQAGPVGQKTLDLAWTSQGDIEEIRHLFRDKAPDDLKTRIIDSHAKFISSEETNVFEDEDFVDGDEYLMNLGESEVRNMLPVTHLHREDGEILVPCFGMWWPVGGVYYDYGTGDYYGDYRRRRGRRRSRKQKKKAARMKKKKA